MSKLNRGFDRRNLLRTSAAAVAGLSTVPITGAAKRSDTPKKPDDEEYIELLERANKIRENANSRAMRNYLEAHGVSTSTVKHGQSASDNNSSDGVSTNEFDNVDGNSSDCDICLEFSLFSNYDGTTYTIDMDWSYDKEDNWLGHTDSGEAPVDVVGLYYESDMWSLYNSSSISKSTNTSTHVTPDDDDTSTGIAFGVNDTLGDDQDQYAQLTVYPTGSYDETTREVRGEYVHTYNKIVDNLSFSVSWPLGVSGGWSQDTEIKAIETGSEGDGDTPMAIKQVSAQ